MNDVIGILKRCALFAGVETKEVEQAVQGAERLHFDTGDEIIAEHSDGHSLYIVLGGEVVVSKTVTPRKRESLHRFGLGDFFGEMSMLDNMPRSAGVFAVGACEVLRIHREKFAPLMASSIKVASNLVWAVSDRLRRTNDHLVGILETQNRRLRRENERLNETISSNFPSDLVSRNAETLLSYQTARKAAPSPASMLLLGESGTGKEVIAHAVHRWSDRRAEPFCVINCAAIPGHLLESELFGHENGAFTGATQQKLGKFELADGGTVFLDEIGDMAEEMQPKVLRFLQSREFERVGGTKTIRVDVRIIAATNRNLEEAIKEGSFREDLYYRLNVITLSLVPLRDRLEDMTDLMAYFLNRFSADLKKPVKGFAGDVTDAFMRYSWPGNIRELSNAVERAVVLCEGDTITLADLPCVFDKVGTAPPELSRPLLTYKEAVDESKREVIAAALAYRNGNQSRAAEILDLERTHLSRLMKQLGLRQ